MLDEPLLMASQIIYYRAVPAWWLRRIATYWELVIDVLCSANGVVENNVWHRCGTRSRILYGEPRTRSIWE